MLLLLLLDRFWRTVVITRLTGDVGGGVLFVMVPLHTPQGEPTFKKLDSHQHTVNNQTINLTTFTVQSLSVGQIQPSFNEFIPVVGPKIGRDGS